MPIKESLHALFTDESVIFQFLNPLNPKPNVFCDFTDGSVYKSNAKVQEGKCINLILFQDAFEIANPLGSAKSKHKILAVYFILGNLYAFNRSSVDHTQLILLCKEKDFKEYGAEKTFGQLVSDLKDLESTGIVVRGQSYPVILSAIAGDNLGSHCIGGFTENFSSSEHFCRFCEISRQDFLNNVLAVGNDRTIRSYRNAVRRAEERDHQLVTGIKHDSVFNRLDFYHVSSGLPPCLAHDLFEGIVNFDLALYLRYFVKTRKWLTYEKLSQIVKNFKNADSDAGVKACPPSETKLGGNASQNWYMLRLLPLLVGHLIQDKSDDVWQLILLLREIVQLVTAPAISGGQVAYMHICIQEYMYIDSRANLFPDVSLRPKHHYLLHYPALTLKFGPLVNLWTLRFESKHQFFKRCIRASHNFINVTSMLAERHQFLQAYNSATVRFGDDISANRSIPLYSGTYCDVVSKSLAECGCHKDGVTQVSDTVTMRGTCYKRDMVVIMDREDNTLILGQIVLIIVDEVSLHFLVKKRSGRPRPSLGIYILEQPVIPMYCVPYSRLLDHSPLSVCSMSGSSCIVIKHEPLQ